MIILVINCGSSSIKYKLLDMENEEHYKVLAKGIAEKIGLDMGRLTHSPSNKEKFVRDLEIADHKIAIKLVIDALTDAEHGVLKSLEDIDAVGHRVVHGGEYFSDSALVSDDVVKKIEKCNDFAPLHNPANLLGIEAVSHALPKVPQVTVFDTAFHQTMPSYAYIYGLPYEYYEKYGIRRYGFHGTSHKFVADKAAKQVGIDVNHSKIITCHIGNGSSVTAIVNGVVVDTSMGFTPLEGMLMGTRCGNIDASIVPYIMKKENLSPDEILDVLNKKSGFLGLSGQSSDARDMDELANAGDKRAKLVLKKLSFDLIKNIGQYVAVMNGVDLIVFTGGIGEHSSRLRRRVCENLQYLGLDFDYEANTAWGEDAIISTPKSKVFATLTTTDEELVIARDTMKLVDKNKD